MPDATEHLRPRPRVPALRRPLPDAQAITAFAVPEVAPPYDDMHVAGQKPPAEVPAAAADPGHGRDMSASLPAPVAGSWPGQFAQALSEALAGSRPASQLTPWTTEQARARIRQLGPMLAQRDARGARARACGAPQPRVRRVIVTSPARGVLEMTIVIDQGSRSRALAVRLERRGVRPAQRPSTSAAWLCTAVEAA